MRATKRARALAVRKLGLRDIGESPGTTWKSILKRKPLTLDQCEETAGWAFRKMSRSQRARAVFELMDFAYSLKR